MVRAVVVHPVLGVPMEDHARAHYAPLPLFPDNCMVLVAVALHAAV